MKILYITYDGLTDPLGRSQVLPYLCGLSQKGHEITILSCDKPDRYKASSAIVNDIVRANGITWKSIPYASGIPILSAVYNIYRMKKAAKKTCRQQMSQIVHCRSYMASFIGVLLKQKYGLQYIFDMRGFFADERVDGKVWNRKNPVYNAVYKYFKRKEKLFLSAADYVISLTNAGKQVLQEQMHVTAPVMVIPCCADLQHFSISNVQEDIRMQLQEQLHIENQDTVISYVGSLGTWYMLEEMMQMVSLLMQKRPHVKFLLITPDSREKVLNLSSRYGIPEKNVIVTYSSREMMPAYISLSHISLFFIQPVFSKKASSPTKMGELLSMGIPLIVNAGVGDVDEIISHSHCGYVVKDFTTAEYERAILQIDNLLRIPKPQLHAAAEAYYSLEQGVEKYNRVYTSLLQ
ncbi:MAG: glycosyltransferase [Bacteroidales bacterium]|nr:glycosyltransferase [Bacteroidales bacterium]